jgi:hypothetical protein
VPSIKNIEKDIHELEGFEVRISSSSTKRNLPEYDYGRAARAAFTVADWKRARFERNYPELKIEVLRGDGKVATNTLTLAKIRAGYE